MLQTLAKKTALTTTLTSIEGAAVEVESQKILFLKRFIGNHRRAEAPSMVTALTSRPDCAA
ncbi:hypothetical protein [Ruegeria sp. HKCCD7318]|uniref:hypothetical protein n=1 Tax=Ruegeria sp. HKCCD7318 TaxID=2683014 RepID=UPI00147C061B|nr:hypothetical protein [Ruegeria sp. HKCCD7318]NOE33369.1 hypothetical protein [Ruegeria sp. HKCCD7318]